MALSQRELAVAKLLQREEANPARFVSMQLGINVDDGDSVTRLLTVGGEWDRSERRFRGDAERETVVTLHPGQAAAGQWFAEWFSRRVTTLALIRRGVTVDDAIDTAWTGASTDPVFSVMFHGGRRGGKSHLAAVIGAATAIAIPESRVVIVSPQLDDTREFRTVLERQLLATEWREWKTRDDSYELANDSVIEMQTGRRDDLKIGPIDIAIYNEAQKMAEKPFVDLEGCVADLAGLAIACCNPPRKTTGRWVQDYHRRVRERDAEDEVSARTFHFDPEKNPHTSKTVLRKAAARMDERTYRCEILGDMDVAIGDLVFEQYSDIYNLRNELDPSWVDVTPEMTACEFEGPANWVVGCDFDKRPGCCWIAAKFFRPPDLGLDAAVMHILYSELIRGGDEHQMAARLRVLTDDRGQPLFTHENTVLVGDASGRWQNVKRNHQDPNRVYSHEIMESHGWRTIRPDAYLKSNPDVDKRFALANSSLRSFDGSRRVFIHRRATEVVESCRGYPMKNGRPERRSVHAHPADAWTYVLWRAWGRQHERQIRLAYEGQPRRERAEQLDGW